MTATHNTRLISAAVVKKDNRILLCKSRMQSDFGKWVLPGGEVHFLESYKDTIKREIREKMGLEVSVGEFIGLYENLEPPDNHSVIIYSWCQYQGGEVISDRGLLEAKFLELDEVREIARHDVNNILLKTVLQDIGWF